MDSLDPVAFVQKETVIGRASLVPEIELHLAGEVTPLWQATEVDLAENGLPPPYWAFAWPGGQALARFLIDNPDWARGRTVLDFAAGCGIGGIAAAKSGASQVTACEIDNFAATAVRLNAALNGVSVTVLEEDMLSKPAPRFDLILAGDVCYEKPMAERAMAWLTQAAKGGAQILLADPGRSYLPKSGLQELARYQVPTPLDLEKSTMMETTVYRLI